MYRQGLNTCIFHGALLFKTLMASFNTETRVRPPYHTWKGRARLAPGPLLPYPSPHAVTAPLVFATLVPPSGLHAPWDSSRLFSPPHALCAWPLPAACCLLPCLLTSISIVCLSWKNVQLPVGGGLCVHPVSTAPGTQCVLNEHVNEWGSLSESCRVTNEPLGPATPAPRFSDVDR